MTRKTAYYRLIRMTVRARQDALFVGRYPPPYTYEAYEKRDRSKAFKCIAYQDAIRNVTALDLACEVMLLEAVRHGEIAIGRERGGRV